MVATGRHRREEPRSRTRWIVAAVVVVSLVLAGGVVVLALRGADHAANAAAPPPPPSLSVVTTTPDPGAGSVASSTAVTVSFSTALSADSPMPSFDPPVIGAWSSLSPTELQFTAAGPLVPGSHETLVVPGGSQGVEGARGQRLSGTDDVAFNVAPGSMLRLQQLLAELGYLPVTFTQTAPVTSPQQEADAAPGTFSWRWASASALTSLWTPGQDNVVTRGAIMRFEDAHGLTTDGFAGPQVWTDLLEAAATGTSDPAPYAYVSVSESQPETVTVYQNGAEAYSTLANTGVPAAPTAQGTFPVYARYTSTTMKGTNPDGSHYSDPGVPWVSYFNGGDALHGFDRPGYGYPQSDGCVEMPPSNAEVVFPMTPIGTLVTVV